MKIRHLFLASIVMSSAAAIAPSQAQAALTSAGFSCTAASTSQVTAGGEGYIDCSGAWLGNDANQQSDLLSQLTTDFADTIGKVGTWSLAGKTDAGKTDGPFNLVPDTKTGEWKLDAPISGYFAVVLKASDSFSTYLFEGTNVSSGFFNTIGSGQNKKGEAQGLSHASLYVFNPRGDEDPGEKVPEPAMVLGSIVALGVGSRLRRRQK